MGELPKLPEKRPSAESAKAPAPPADFADVDPCALPAVFKTTKAQDVRYQIGRARVQALRSEAHALKAKDIGPQTREAFVAHLKRSFGNVMRAWKEGLDSDGNGRLSKMEFCGAARAIGFCGSLQTLWNELDRDHGGMVTIDEICPEVGQLTTEFRRKLIVHGGGHLVLAWNSLLDTDHSGRVEKAEFLECCEKIHFTGDAKKLFSWYDYDHSGYITLEEIDPSAYQQLQRGDDERGLLVLDGQKHDRGGPFSATEGSKRRGVDGLLRKEKLQKLARACSAPTLTGRPPRGTIYKKRVVKVAKTKPPKYDYHPPEAEVQDTKGAFVLDMDALKEAQAQAAKHASHKAQKEKPKTTVEVPVRKVDPDEAKRRLEQAKLPGHLAMQKSSANLVCRWWSGPSPPPDELVGMFKNLNKKSEAAMRKIATQNGLTMLEVEKVAKVFSKYDTDKSGEIDKSEFRHMINDLLCTGKTEGVGVPEAHITEYFLKCDHDGSGEIDQEEFVRWYCSDLQPMLLNQGPKGIGDEAMPAGMIACRRPGLGM